MPNGKKLSASPVNGACSMIYYSKRGSKGPERERYYENLYRARS
nr:MAG TPA: Protein of unknown function (DUF3796) [Caudoviricetes sp.]